MRASSTASPEFDPSPELVRAADILFVAMAREEATRRIVEPYEQAILDASDYRIERGEHPDAGERIRDRKLTYLMSDAEFKDYYAKCQAAVVEHNLHVRKPGNCPLLEAEHLRIQAENLFLELMHPHTKIDHRTLTLELRAEVLDLSLKLISPHANPHARFGLPVGDIGRGSEEPQAPKP